MYFRIAFNQICWEYKNIEDSLPAVSHNSRRSLPPHDLTNICIKNKLFDKNVLHILTAPDEQVC